MLRCIGSWLASGIERRWVVAAWLACLLVPTATPVPTLLLAQEAAAEKDKKKREVPPETVEDIEADDGVAIKATFYPGMNGQETVPVLMLHGWKGSRADYHRLAKYLQSEYGHAVLVPDQRGHGESVRVKGDAKSPPLNPDRLKPEDLRRMAAEDMESYRRFLKRRNNDGQLNLDKLCVVGADTSAIFALNWTAYDWSAPGLARVKQSQFVKGLVLLSPEWSFRKLQVGEALRTLGAADQLSVFIVFGRKNSSAAKNAERINNHFQQARPNDAKEPDLTKRSLWLDDTDTSLQGTQMLGQELGIEELVAQFIELQVAAKKCPWQSYESLTK